MPIIQFQSVIDRSSFCCAGKLCGSAPNNISCGSSLLTRIKGKSQFLGYLRFSRNEYIGAQHRPKTNQPKYSADQQTQAENNDLGFSDFHHLRW